MPDPIRLRRLNFHDDHHDIVRLIVSSGDGGVVADVVWPANALTDGGDYLYPTYVPLALERAEDVRQNYGFSEVAVIIDDPALWDPAWGQLV
ncbi:MAG: hypothetical protein ABWY49_01445 [Rhizobium sp.]